MPPKSKDSESLIAGLEGIKSIQETITSETEKMNNIMLKCCHARISVGVKTKAMAHKN